MFPCYCCHHRCGCGGGDRHRGRTCLADGICFAVVWFSLCLAGCCIHVHVFGIVGFFSSVDIVIYMFLKSVSIPSASLWYVLLVACVTFQFVDVQHL